MYASSRMQRPVLPGIPTGGPAHVGHLAWISSHKIPKQRSRPTRTPLREESEWI